jgi:hypothetical protein
LLQKAFSKTYMAVERPAEVTQRKAPMETGAMTPPRPSSSRVTELSTRSATSRGAWARRGGDDDVAALVQAVEHVAGERGERHEAQEGVEGHGAGGDGRVVAVEVLDHLANDLARAAREDGAADPGPHGAAS